MIYLCQLGRHLLLILFKTRLYNLYFKKNWIVTLKPIELEPGKLFVLTVVQYGDLIVVSVFIYSFIDLFTLLLSFFIHFSNYLGVASLGPRVRSRAPSCTVSWFLFLFFCFLFVFFCSIFVTLL